MSQADEGKALEPVPAPSARQSRERAMDRLFQQLLKVPSPKTLAHLVRFLGTWTGTDKFFMLAQYGSNVLVAVLLFLHALRKRSDKSSVILRLVPRIRALGSLSLDGAPHWVGLRPLMRADTASLRILPSRRPEAAAPARPAVRTGAGFPGPVRRGHLLVHAGGRI